MSEPSGDDRPRRPRTPSSWTRRELDGWFVFYPCEGVRCPCVDRRTNRPGGSDRRSEPRACDRISISLSAGTMARVRQLDPEQASWAIPGGTIVCVKCGAVLEVQLIPIHPDFAPSPGHPGHLGPLGVTPRPAPPPAPRRDEPPPHRSWIG